MTISPRPAQYRHAHHRLLLRHQDRPLDLLALLDSGHLAGAALDVFRTEPLPAEHPFWRHPKITVTPHTSARTLRDESVAQVARKIAAFERGEPISGVVDRKKGY